MSPDQLTDRYRRAFLAATPPADRASLQRDIDELLIDASERAREALGDEAPDPDVARAALTELGDPAALAASYADHPQYLIGPRTYLAWKRITKLVLVTSLPAVAAALVLAFLIDGRGLGGALLSALGITILVGLSTAFVTTMVFAAIDRSGVPTTQPWTPDALPDQPPTSEFGGVGMLIGSLAGITLAAASIAVQHLLPVFSGGMVPSVINPELWPWLAPVVIVLLLATIAFLVARWRLGQWTWTLAISNVALAAAWAFVAIWTISSGELINPDFAAFIEFPWGSADLGGVLAALGIVGVLASAVWEAYAGLRGAARTAAARRSPDGGATDA